MPYTPTTWVDDGAPAISAANLQNMETGIDDATTTADAALPKAGGTMTGFLTLSADPTNALHAATRQFVLAQITALVNSAPGALDTLKELADALGDDANFAATMTAALAGKASTASVTNQAEVIGVALSDETTAITTGTAKATIRMPFAMTVTAVRASVNTASSSGLPTVDINEGGASILSTKLTIDATEKTSVTAAAPAVISDGALADDAEITFDIDVAGTGAKGLKVWLIGTRA